MIQPESSGGNVRPESVMFASMKPPCQLEEVWH